MVRKREGVYRFWQWTTKKGDTPLRVREELIIEPARSWRRVQELNEWFVTDLEQLQRRHRQQFREALIRYERKCFFNAESYEHARKRVNQAKGFLPAPTGDAARGLGIGPAAQPQWRISNPTAAPLLTSGSDRG